MKYDIYRRTDKKEKSGTFNGRRREYCFIYVLQLFVRHNALYTTQMIFIINFKKNNLNQKMRIYFGHEDDQEEFGELNKKNEGK